jgi:acyl-CoA thioester hydrolase
MIKNTTYLRVRYNETDQMGVVNNAQYATYFEIGRTELFRELGLEYGQIEKDGLMLPVSELQAIIV